MADTPPFLMLQVGPGGRLLNPHQTTLLRFRHQRESVWKGGLSVPVFWPTLFAAEHMTANGATIEWASALLNLERRQDVWKVKASPLLFRGYSRFLEWVRAIGCGHVTLEVGGLDAWRHEPLLAAVKDLIGFFDGATDEPGLLLKGDELVGWTKRRKGVQLEARTAGLAWPDEVPLFAVRHAELANATTGTPPFREGPWPERRFAEDELAGLPREVDAAVKARSALVARTLKSCPNRIELSAAFGNIEALELARTRYRSLSKDFRRDADVLANSAKAFAEAHQVFDDTALWKAMLTEAAQWEANMETAMVAQEQEITAAMNARSSKSGSSRELTLDDFPSGDEPF